MTGRIFFSALLTITLAAGVGLAQVGKGAEFMKLEAGPQGRVPFPHHNHQAALNDCLVCHSYFAQQKGSIAKAISGGQLNRRQVMNQLCIQCHRAEKEAGRPAGPLTCTACHQKG